MRTLIRGIRDTKIADSRRLEVLKSLISNADDLDDHVLGVTDTTGMARVRVNKVGGGHLELD